jgi:hypothetical protein
MRRKEKKKGTFKNHEAKEEKEASDSEISEIPASGGHWQVSEAYPVRLGDTEDSDTMKAHTRINWPGQVVKNVHVRGNFKITTWKYFGDAIPSHCKEHPRRVRT